MANKTLSDKKVNEIYNFIRKNIGKDAAEGFRKRDDKVQWIKDHWNDLEEFEAWTLKYSSVEDLTKPSIKVLEDIFNKNPDINAISEARMKTILNNNDISEKELRDYYKLRYAQQEQVDKFNKERYDELNKLSEEYKRAHDNSYYNTPIANEYARKHYIKGNPIQAGINEVAGKVAAIADFGPPIISLLAPTIRTTQKWAADEPVLTTGTAADFGGGSLGFVGKIPGVKSAVKGFTGKIQQLLTRSNNPTAKEIGSVINANTKKEAETLAKKDLEIISKDLDRLSDVELVKLYESTDNPIIKNEIERVHKARAELNQAKYVNEQLLSDPKTSKFANAPQGSAEKVIEKEQQLDNVMNDVAKEQANIQAAIEVKAGKVKEPIYSSTGDFSPYYKDVPFEDIVEYQRYYGNKPSNTSKFIGNMLLGVGRKVSGQSIAHRNWNEIDYKPDYNEDKAINEVIKMYSDGWQVDRLPSNYNEPLIKAAYDKWLNDNKFNYIYNWRIK